MLARQFKNMVQLAIGEELGYMRPKNTKSDRNRRFRRFFDNIIPMNAKFGVIHRKIHHIHSYMPNLAVIEKECGHRSP